MAKWSGGKTEHEILQDTAARIASARGVPLQAIRYVTTVYHNGQNWTVQHEWQQKDGTRWVPVEPEQWCEID